MLGLRNTPSYLKETQVRYDDGERVYDGVLVDGFSEENRENMQTSEVATYLKKTNPDVVVVDNDGSRTMFPYQRDRADHAYDAEGNPADVPDPTESTAQYISTLFDDTVER